VTVAEFLELSPGKRRLLVAYVRNAMLEQGGIDPDPDFSLPSRTWVERTESALADSDVSQSSFDQLARPYSNTSRRSRRKSARRWGCGWPSSFGYEMPSTG